MIKAPLVFALLGFLVFPNVNFAMGSKKNDLAAESKTPSHVPNQVLVSLKKNVSKAERKLMWDQWELQEIENIGSTPLFLLEYKGSKKVMIPELVKEIEKNENVKYAEPNMIQKTFTSGSPNS